MFTGTGLIKLYSVLQKTGCLSEGCYTVLKLERLLTLNQLMDLSKLMQSPVTPYLLLIVCEDKEQLDEETRDISRTLFDTTKQNIKTIFITTLGGNISHILHHLNRRLFGNACVRVPEELTWSDLITSPQQKPLEKSVKFLGSKFYLNELVCAESPTAKFLSLVDLFVGQLQQWECWLSVDCKQCAVKIAVWYR
jgi:hypothetical protein